jgi:hypothetical protein
MPYKLKDFVRHKFTKKSYNERDWKIYEEGLRNQGDLPIWFCKAPLPLGIIARSKLSHPTY